MNLENEMRNKSFTPSKFEQNTDASAWKPKTLIDVEDAINIAKQYAEERYYQAQYDLIVMITQDMFNACSLNLPLEYVGNLKKQLKSKLATETK
jgi:hypothetical protein